MQTKTIEKNIKTKMEQWLQTITDDKLRKDVKDNLLVTGGCISSMFLNEPVNDYDIYLMDIDVCKRIAEYYTSTIESIVIFDGREKDKLVEEFEKNYEHTATSDLGINKNSSHAISLRNLKEDQIKLYFNGATGGLRVNETIEVEKLNYTPLFFSPNAISLSNDIQIVLRFWGIPSQIHKTFDYVHATNYFTFKEGVVTNLPAVESILTKQLKYQGSHYPVTSIIRAKKFLKRGFNITAGELLKIMFQISKLDLENADVLEEQLIGVDVAYFDLIIAALRNKRESEPNFKLSSEYFNTLIDKIFNENES